jgi:hypothetical protein
MALAGTTADLCEQFVLSRSLDTPDGFETEHLASWRLAHHPTLPVIAIRDADQRTGGPDADRVGWLLGYPVTSDGVLLRNGSNVTVGADEDPLAFVESLGGRFLAVFVNCRNPAIYPDAAATYGSVFCRSLEVAASTPGLVPYADTTGDREGLVEQLGIPLTDSMYPLALTPRHGVCQLLPNHHLDLRTWTMVRHGPRWQERGSINVDDSVSRIAEIIRRNIHAMMDAYPCYLQLTAGSDSRMLLACARERSSELATYTLRIPDLSGMNDAKIAARLSGRAGVPHQAVAMPKPDHDDLDRWMYRTSCGVGEVRGMRAATALRSLDRSRAHLGGNIGDLAHNDYWATVDGPESSPRSNSSPCTRWRASHRGSTMVSSGRPSRRRSATRSSAGGTPQRHPMPSRCSTCCTSRTGWGAGRGSGRMPSTTGRASRCSRCATAR